MRYFLKSFSILIFFFIFLIIKIHAISFTPFDTTFNYSFPSIKSLKTEPEGPKGLEVIGNFGAYLADKRHAAFYNGAPQNVNNINFVLDNYYWKENIKEILRTTVNRDSFMLSEYPQNMKYSVTMNVGFGFRYNYNPSWALNFQINVCKLTAKDFFTIEVFPAFDNQSKSYLNYGIMGLESRTIIDLGLVRTFKTDKNIRPLLELGLNFNNTLVKEAYIVIEEQKFSTINIYGNRNYIPNSNNPEYQIRQGGIGFGAYGGAGLKWVFNNFLSLETVVYLYMSQINLEEYEGFGYHTSGFLRFVMSPALLMSKD